MGTLLLETQRVNSICPIECRKGACTILTTLREAGYTTYFAGGCVRDRLLSIAPTEYDIATSARPEEIKSIFPKARSVGESFGVMLIRSNHHMFDVATFRCDGPYSDHRHPDSIQFSDAKHDAFRRDFSVNGMFEDPINESIIDYVNGQEDIKNRLIRAIGNPHDRIAEDHLRMLRAVRFAARFAFSIESETADAIRELSPELAGVSRERIGDEIRRMMTGPNRGVAAWELQYLGLDRIIFAEQPCMNAPTRLGRLPSLSCFATALAAWIIDRHGSESDVHEIASSWRCQLLLSNKVYNDLLEILSLHQQCFAWDSMGTAKQKKIAASSNFLGALAIVQGEDRAAFVHIKHRITELTRSGLTPERLIDGHDLLGAGIRPSASLGRVLEAVYDAQLEGSISTKQQAIELALSINKDFQDT